MPAGRPTKYDPSFVQEADRYLEEVSQKPRHLPKIESFAIRLGVVKSTLYEWAKNYPQFSNALGKIMVFQAQRLIDDGIYGDVNSTIIKLLLQNNHGMRDRGDITTDNEKISNIDVKIVTNETRPESDNGLPEELPSD